MLLIETTGRITGRRIRAAVGYVEEPGGSYLVAAGDHGADWARNLLADPHCRIGMAGWTRAAVAEQLTGRDGAAAIRDLILRYGTPAERLGSGPAFRLRPIP